MIVKEGFRNIKFFLIISICFFIVGRAYSLEVFLFISSLFFIFSLFSVYFFRNPKRNIKVNDKYILCPADGKIMEIVEEYNEVLQTKCKVIRIFLSVFNVHVQRSPISGKIIKIDYKNGKFLPAMNPNAHIENEQNLVVFESNDGQKKIICSQIAGLIARNIVTWKNENDDVSMGELYGMIKFGSQVDIYIPENVQINVVKNQTVLAGETILAHWKF
jgi:phosphatidylserine decarboxylase